MMGEETTTARHAHPVMGYLAAMLVPASTQEQERHSLFPTSGVKAAIIVELGPCRYNMGEEFEDEFIPFKVGDKIYFFEDRGISIDGFVYLAHDSVLAWTSGND